MSAPVVLEDATEAVYWRERAVRAEASLAEAHQRIGELSEQVAVLSRMLFGRLSEKTGAGGPAAPVGDGDGAELDETVGCGPGGFEGLKSKRGQRPGSKGHGRRDYSGLCTREEIHDVPSGQQACAGCGRAFEVLGSECGEQIDWQVTITRIVRRRLRYRRRCECPGPRTVIAPVAPSPIAKGRFTARFLARLLYQNYVLGLPVHRIVRALAAEGLDVVEGTLAGALKALAGLLKP